MWIALTGWAVVGWVSGLLITFALALTLGGAMVNLPYEYTLARIFYTLGFVILLARIGYWLAFELEGYYAFRIFGAAMIFALIGIAWIGSVVWVSERECRQATPAKQLGNEHTIRERLYKQFMEEKTRRVSVYSLSITYWQLVRANYAKTRLMAESEKKEAKEEMQRAEDKLAVLVKEQKEEDAKFTGLVTEIKLHFKHSGRLESLCRRVLNPEPYNKDDKPIYDDLKTDEAWLSWIKRANAMRDEYINTAIKSPLNDLQNYLESEIGHKLSDETHEDKPNGRHKSKVKGSIMPPTQVIIQSPSVGNLKQRAIALSEEIMKDLYSHGWPCRNGSFKGPIMKQMPQDYEGVHKWQEVRSLNFRGLLGEIHQIRNEFAGFHIIDKNLDDLIKREDTNQMVDKALSMTGHKSRNMLISPGEIEQFSERLKILAEQIKD
jgi:hypothetical protein